MLVFSIGILLMFFLLIGRLIQIQLIQTETFSKHQINLLAESVKQRTQELVIDDGRGDFLDMNNEPLSYEEKKVLVLFPFLNHLEWDRHHFAEIVQLSVTTLNDLLNEAKEPFILGEITDRQAIEIEELNIPGIIAIDKKIAPQPLLAGQLIGITGENQQELLERYPERKGIHPIKIGISGLQQQFDPFLLPEIPSKLIFHVNGIGDPLFGIDVKYTGQSNPYYPLNVKTTLHKQIQENIESLVDHHKMAKGGVVLLDIETNNVVALASRPSIQLQSPFVNEGTRNFVFEEHIPGSVFKTIVAAAAIQEDIVKHDEIFDCSVNIRGMPATRDLGHLNLEHSFSRSCNNTFAILANRLQGIDEDLLEEYGEKLGVLGSVSWHGDIFQLKGFQQFTHAKGRVFSDPNYKTDKNYVAQTGIGQHEVRLSPIAVANMMATIARGGEKHTVRVASDIQYGNGTTMFTFPRQQQNDQKISKYTAMKLQQLLRLVVTDENGTGRLFQNAQYDVAGKSGTAQTGLQDDNQELYHKWFAGYFPFEDPKYALVVVYLDVLENEGSPNLLFADIVDMLHHFHESPHKLDD